VDGKGEGGRGREGGRKRRGIEGKGKGERRDRRGGDAEKRRD